VERWEYRVLSFPKGGYTNALNELGREGWELVSVTPEPPRAEEPASSGLPMPRAFERIEDAASKLTPASPTPPAGAVLLWVLRRPLVDEER
jgi:hypothetical protein